MRAGGRHTTLLWCAAALLTACANDAGSSATSPRLVFRLANELTADGKIWEVSRLFMEELERASPDGSIGAGEIDVVFYDQGQVGTERQLLENAYFGVMEVVQINSSVVTTIDPAYSLFDLPYIFVSSAHHKAVLNGAIGDVFLQRLRDRNLIGLGFYSLGFRDMFYRARNGSCITKPEDLRGLKLRVIESPIMIAGINALGASATPVPFSELFQALRTGVVDGADNAARVFMASRFYETGTNCFTRTEHFTNQHVLVANDDWFQSLEPKYQRRILEVARNIVPEFANIWDTAAAEAFASMAAAGVTVSELPDKQPFMARVENVAERFLSANPAVPRNLFEQIKAAGATAR